VPGTGRVAILTYHSLDESGSVLSTTPRLFAEQMQAVHDAGWRVVDLTTALQALAAGPLSSDLIALTFDDGFRNFAQSGLPVLRHFGFPATVFLVTDYCGRSNDWPGQTESVQRLPLLQWRQVGELAAGGITIGSHTRTHPDLTTLQSSSIERELHDSRVVLEAALQQPVDLLAYPYGTHSHAVRHTAARHYRLACSTHLDFCGPESDPHALNRLDVFYLRNLDVFRNLFSGRVGTYLHARRYLRDVRHQLRVRLRSRRKRTGTAPC
jgi:peptidoglycan/xylan/chitin deacetylase (PgdA/CDA1 family)